MHARMAQFQKGFQHSRQSEVRLRVALCRRLAKDYNANGLGAFYWRKADGLGRPGHARAEETPAKTVILNQNRLSIPF